MGVSPGTKACKVFSSCRSSGACWPAGPSRAFQRKGPLVHAGSVFCLFAVCPWGSGDCFSPWDRPSSCWTAWVLNTHGRDGDEDFVASSCKNKLLHPESMGSGLGKLLGWLFPWLDLRGRSLARGPQVLPRPANTMYVCVTGSVSKNSR